MSTSREAGAAAPADAFEVLPFPDLGVTAGGSPAAGVPAAVQRGYAMGLARGRRRTERERARLLTELAHRNASAEAERERRVAEAVARLDAACAAVRATAAPVLADADRALADGVLSLTAAVLGADAAADPTRAAAAAVARVLAHEETEAPLVIRLHPADLELLTAAGALPDRDGVAFEADAALAQGDAVAALPDGLLDARIASALDRARRAFEEAAG
ncbi:FliH/SctL family protein [Agromyces sp. G08B096]|uniref:FliH/SctL family protein n=1 Tax=Agromyces sp. G08B096 TaxID=3156399 RepID=A0AAU7W798_9MICO